MCIGVVFASAKGCVWGDGSAKGVDVVSTRGYKRGC